MPAQTPQVILFAAFSRPLSRCFSLLDRPPGLGLWCAEETSSAQWTIGLPSLYLLTRRREEASKERLMGLWGPHASASSLSFQDGIGPLSEEQDLSRDASGCPRGFCT